MKSERWLYSTNQNWHKAKSSCDSQPVSEYSLLSMLGYMCIIYTQRQNHHKNSGKCVANFMKISMNRI